jgi:hypothetical protein
MQTRWVAIVMAAALSASMLAGCGGGGDKDKTPTGTAAASDATSGAGKSTSTAPAGGTTSTSTPDSGSSGPTGPGSDELKALAKKFTDSTFKGTYKLTTSSTDPSSDAITDGQMVLYKDGDKRFRFDVTATQGDQPVSVIFIQTGETSVFCLKDAGELGALFGIAAGEGVCINSASSDENPVGTISSTFSDIENADITVLDRSSRTVAGKDGDCFRGKDNKTAEISTICFDKDGVILYADTEGADASKIEATDVAGSVSDGDFTPPYEIRDIPGLGGGDSTP